MGTLSLAFKSPNPPTLAIGHYKPDHLCPAPLTLLFPSLLSLPFFLFTFHLITGLNILNNNYNHQWMGIYIKSELPPFLELNYTDLVGAKLPFP